MLRYKSDCDTIAWYDKCDECPMREKCPDENYYELSDEQAELIRDFAEEVLEEEEQNNMTEEERRWQAKADYWNDRRCDPEDYD